MFPLFSALVGHVDGSNHLLALQSSGSVFFVNCLVMLGLKLETQHTFFAPKLNPVTFNGEVKNVALFLKPIKFPHSGCPN